MRPIFKIATFRIFIERAYGTRGILFTDMRLLEIMSGELKPPGTVQTPKRFLITLE